MHSHLLAPDLRVSTLCLGVMPWGATVHGADAAALGDRFREAGGNFFDTAHCYSFWVDGVEAGSSERAFGAWLQDRGDRDDVIIATKGAHPAGPGYRDDVDYMTQARIAQDISDSLERLQTDWIDLYWLHRDDPRVDVGSIVDWLYAERQTGRIRSVGASNWTAPRIAAAQAYAEAHGIPGFVASQPQWSLVDYPPQTDEQRLAPEALLHLNAADRAWHTHSQLPVIPYGSTGNGFFASHGERAARFANATTLARLERCESLARELAATPNQIALAWLLAQPFPVIPILGTANPEHLADAIAAPAVTLTDAQRDWLVS